MLINNLTLRVRGPSSSAIFVEYAQICSKFVELGSEKVFLSLQKRFDQIEPPEAERQLEKILSGILH